MAFGALRGTLTGNAASIPNPAICAGSVAVSVGDLVVAICGQQTNLTVTGCTDNLGNTYTAQNAGTDNVGTTARVFYSRVTVAGTLTEVRFATTSSTNDWAGIAGVHEGPFASSPVDQNKANITTDVSSPFNCPATGTLSQADEVVIAWGAANQSTTWSTSGGNMTLTGNANNSSNIKVALAYGIRTATTDLTPQFSAGSNPTECILGTVTFKKDLSKSITVDGGSYTVTGTAATLKFGRKVAADGGTYAVTGTAATLRRNLPLAATGGSYAVTGVSATLLFKRLIAATAGSYTVGGTDTSLEFGRKIAADGGSYAVTGADVTLTYAPATGYTLAVDGGSYAVSGVDASLKFGRKVAAGGGAYVVSGTDASLEFGRKVAGDSGSYTVSGAAASLEFGFKLAADGGSYSVDGVDASLEHGYKLAPDGGAYAVEGSDASLIYAPAGAYVIAANGGAYSVAGGSAALKFGRVLVAGPGAYAVIGGSATLTASGAPGSAGSEMIWMRRRRR